MLNQENKRVRKALKKSVERSKTESSVSPSNVSEESIKELEESNAGLRTDIEGLRKAYDGSKEAIRSLETRNAALQKNIAELREELDLSRSETNSLAEEAAKVMETVEKDKSDMSQLQAEAARLSSELETSKEKLASAKKLHSDQERQLEESVASARAELSEVKAELKRTLETLEVTKKDSDTLAEESIALVQKAEEQRAEVIKMKEEMKKLREEITKKNTSEKEFEKVSTEHAEALEALKRDHQIAMTKCRDELDMKTSAIDDIRTQHESQIETLQKSLSEEIKVREDQNERIQRLEEERRSMQSESAQKILELETEIKSLTQRLEEARVSARVMTEKYEKIQEDHGDHLTLLSDAKSEIDKMVSARNVAVEARARSEKMALSLKTELEETIERTRKMETENEEWRHKITSITNALDEAKMTIASQERALRERDEQIELSKHKSADLNHQLLNVSKALKSKASVEQRLSMSLRSLWEDVRSVRSDMNALRTTAIGQLKQLPKMISQKDPMWTRLQHLTGKLSERVRLAELNYAREWSERRRLFNIVQEYRGNIRVVCRVRPVLSNEKGSVACSFPMEGTIAVRNERKRREKRWEFDHVFGMDKTTSDLFDEVEPLVTSVMDGYNACLFAYGQTGSGKTYSMEGTKEDPGIYWRALKTLFDMKVARSNAWNIEIKISVLEVYNENIRDLLSSPDDHSRTLPIKMNSRGENYVQGLSMPMVKSIEQIREHMNNAKKVRSTGATNMNEHSSRSHCMLSVYVTARSRVDSECVQGKLHLVDLAGSERLSKSRATGIRQVETKMINKSLSALGDVIQAQANKHPHVPYRNSTLTYLLADSLGGNSKTMMIAQVSPTSFNSGETYCTLEFSSRTRKVELGKATKNLKSDDGKSRAPMQRSKSTSPRARRSKKRPGLLG